MSVLTEILPKLRALLRHRGRSGLADLLMGASLRFGRDDRSSTVEVITPVQAFEELRGLNLSDREAILGGINDIRSQLDGNKVLFIKFSLDTESLFEDAELRQPTGWTLVDRQVAEARKRLAEAKTAEQFQAAGLICREALISLGQVVFDPARHSTANGVDPSSTDGRRRLDGYIAVELAGASQEAARRHARAALSLANDLVHHRTATFRQAALCVEATSSLVNLIAIISGKRDPNDS